MIQSAPALGFEITKLIGRRLQRFQSRIEELLCKSAQARVAPALLDLAERHGIPDADGVLIPLRLSQSDLGRLVGLRRETRSGAITDWWKPAGAPSACGMPMPCGVSRDRCRARGGPTRRRDPNVRSVERDRMLMGGGCRRRVARGRLRHPLPVLDLRDLTCAQFHAVRVIGIAADVQHDALAGSELHARHDRDMAVVCSHTADTIAPARRGWSVVAAPADGDGDPGKQRHQGFDGELATRTRPRLTHGICPPVPDVVQEECSRGRQRTRRAAGGFPVETRPRTLLQVMRRATCYEDVYR
jgi:hypothetical protein